MINLLPRLIPVLLLKNKGLVKSINFKDHKYIGDPINAVRIFSEKEVDEICLLDIEATRNKRPPDFEFIKKIANEAFVPFAYGGGINNLDQAKKIFKLGAEKVVLNTNAFSNPELIKDISNYVGRQSVVVSIDIKINFWGKYSLYNYITGKSTSIDLKSHINSLVDFGAGEIFVNAVHCDGVMKGMDLNLISHITQDIKVPIIACGGVGTLDDAADGIHSGASAVACGSMFVFHGKHKAVLISYPKRSEIKNKFI